MEYIALCHENEMAMKLRQLKHNIIGCMSKQNLSILTALNNMHNSRTAYNC